MDSTWAPGDACTLPTAQRPLRVAEFEQLFASSLIGLDRLEPGWLRLRLDPGGDAERRARELVALESECCSFFDFDVHREAGEVVLDVRVPQNQVPVLDGLGRQAEIHLPAALGANLPSSR